MSNEVRQAYDAWSSTYDADDNPTRDLDAQVVQSVFTGLSGRRVLELGCGTGKNTRHLVEAGADVTALDFSEGMLAKARQNAGAATFVQHDLRQPLPLDAASVDRVLVNLVLEHLEDVAAVMAEIARVLRPGGDALIVEFHPYRQLDGKVARFSRDGEEVRVPAFPHSVAEFVDGALRAGLTIAGIGEWVDGPRRAGPGELPRLLVLQLRR